MRTLLRTVAADSRTVLRTVAGDLRAAAADLGFLLAAAGCDFCKQPLMAGDHRRVCQNCVAKIEGNKLCYEEYRHHTVGGFMAEFPYLCKKCSHPLAYHPSHSSSHSPSYGLSYSLPYSLPKRLSERLSERPSKRSSKYLFKQLSCWVCSERNPLEADKLVTLFFNTGLPKRLMYYYKFSKHPSYIELLCKWILERNRAYFERFDVCVPIALSRREVLKRDFCPVTTVVRKIAKKLGIPMVKVLKKRHEHSALASVQHFKTLPERYSNVRKRFYYDSQYEGALLGKRVLIVDDIYTTGATINIATELIKAHNQAKGRQNNKNNAQSKRNATGVKQVCAFTFLRSVLKYSPAKWNARKQSLFYLKPTPQAKLEETLEDNWTFFT